MPPKTLTLAAACNLPQPAREPAPLVEETPPVSSYDCEACKGLQPLPETAAVVCQRCGWRVLMKTQRQARRVFGTD
jgi:DNA-directed RNA polymerase subunit RPC12/RpoP